MAIINTIIPKQNFELLGERIGAILTTELLNQKTLQSFLEPVNVFVERIEPFNNSEDLIINVMFDRFSDIRQSQSSMQGDANYFIDFYTSAKAEAGKSGGLVSNEILHRFMGMARYIFGYTEYKTLGFEPGIIGFVNVQNLQKASPNEENSAFVTMGRLTLSTQLLEGQPLVDGTALREHLTNVKLELTEKGYKYKLIQEI